MFSSFIRLGIVISGVALLSSCGGSSSGEALTQQSTPEGLFTGTGTILSIPGAVTMTLATSTVPSQPASTVPNLNAQWLVFITSTGPYYAFYSDANNPNTLLGASQGTLTFSGGSMSASNVVEVDFQTPSASNPLYTGAVATIPVFSGSYTTGANITGTFTYTFGTTSLVNGAVTVKPGETVNINLNYNAAYQNVQNLATLAGSYIGTVGTSDGGEGATFRFSPASVPANGGNQFGVSTVTGTSASGCTYTGTASPLFKGNGYTSLITSGGAPCKLPNTQFSGLIYLDTANNFLYSFAPDTARTDGLVFSGKKQL